MRRHPWFAVVLLALGCGSGTLSDEERLAKMVPNATKTTPVTGEVFVEGAPIKDLFVYLIPKGTQPLADEPPAHRARTKEDGSFAITTYMDGDGAPPVDYVVTMEWLKFRQTGSSWVGPDMLLDRYNDPETSEFNVTVGSEKVVVPRFDLKIEGQPPGKKRKKAPPVVREKKHDS